MNLYEKLPNEVLIDFYNEINKNIERGILTKAMFHEIDLILSAMNERGITTTKSEDYKDVV
ncbi:hypothetical protein L1999_15285 [Neobacillus drentensis]|uniref:hypothetical protein n=1 Tax=Neobacillus drentensis TaxID=220684 RepID=UPI001F2B27C5|nr:hypothetical protein [Neobacillus drentensis]ULT54531.1 hypothetical protein L1999_15285 [Neobacillus drentensis]